MLYLDSLPGLPYLQTVVLTVIVTYYQESTAIYEEEQYLAYADDEWKSHFHYKFS